MLAKLKPENAQDRTKIDTLVDYIGYIAGDSLLKTETIEGVGIVPPAEKGKNIWGTVTFGDRGQIVIPKAARDHLGIKGGDRMIVASDDVGIALIPAEFFESKMQEIMNKLSEK